MSWFEANLAPIMFGSLIVFLLTGFPVAFSLAACGMFFGFIGVELGMLQALGIFGSFADLGHLQHRLQRVLAGCGFGRQHHRIGAVQHGIRATSRSPLVTASSGRTLRYSAMRRCVASLDVIA